MNATKFPNDAVIPPNSHVKFGIDPTFSRLHLGHLVPLRIVRQMQQAGHPVTIVLGTFTAQLGDPSGHDTTRPILTKREVEANADCIRIILQKILLPNFNIFENGEIHNIMTLPHFMRIVSRFTLTNLTSRDAFQKRIKEGNSIAMHELLVPICQGWDSVHLQAGVEVGGQDQLFNFQVARQLQEENGQKPQVCLMCPIIRGTDGRKMSKSLNNCIFLDDEPNDMFGKVMSIPDDVMDEWEPLLMDENSVMPSSHSKASPMFRKKVLAFNVVSLCHGAVAALAWDHFTKIIQNKELPAIIDDISASTLVEAIVIIRKCSKMEARRLLAGDGVTVDGKKVTEDMPVQSGLMVRIGKRHFGLVK